MRAGVVVGARFGHDLLLIPHSLRVGEQFARRSFGFRLGLVFAGVAVVDAVVAVDDAVFAVGSANEVATSRISALPLFTSILDDIAADGAAPLGEIDRPPVLLHGCARSLRERGARVRSPTLRFLR